MRVRRPVFAGAKVATALLWAAFAASSVPAQIVGEGRPFAGQIDDTAVITLDVRDRPLEDVLEHIRNKVGVSIVTTPETEGRVSIKLGQIPWREALDLVAENAGCIVTQVSDRLYKVEKPPRVTMSFSDVDIKQVIEAIAKAGNANIIVSERVSGTVTMVIVDRPWRDALDAVVKTNGFYLVEEERGILRVVDEAGLSTHLERRLLRLKYLRPKGTYIPTIDSEYIEGQPKVATHDAMVDFPLLPALKKMLSKEGDLDYFEDENAILVVDTKPVLEEIERFIVRLDVEPVQIYIDVKFISTAKTDTTDYAFGFDQGIDISLSGASRPSRFPFNLGPGSIADNLLPGNISDNINGLGSSNNFGNTATPVAPGLLDFSATTMAIRLIKQDLSAEVVQAPKLITLDHKPGTLFVGESVRYAQAEATTNQSGGLQLTVKEAQNSPVQTGFQLWVTPHVVPGTNKIMMQVIPEAETLTGTTNPALPGFDLFEVGAGTTGEGSISLPRVGSQTLVVEMMLESGETGIIGGLVQNERRMDVTKVPVLGDLPWIGQFFRAQTSRDDERGLLVFLTPHIIRSVDRVDEGLNKILEEHRKNAGSEWEQLAVELGY